MKKIFKYMPAFLSVFTLSLVSCGKAENGDIKIFNAGE